MRTLLLKRAGSVYEGEIGAADGVVVTVTITTVFALCLNVGVDVVVDSVGKSGDVWPLRSWPKKRAVLRYQIQYARRRILLSIDEICNSYIERVVEYVL